LIAIICATWDEIKRNSSSLGVTDRGVSDELQYLQGELNGKPVVVGCTGVGIRKARRGTSYLIEKFKPELIISAGHAGGLKPGLKVGDILVGEWVLSLEKNQKRKLFSNIPRLPELPSGFLKGGLLTGNRFVYDPTDKKRLFQKTGTLSVDMETWGVAEAADKSGVPVIAVRSISDVNQDELPDMGRIYDGSGKIMNTKTLKYFIANPSKFYPFIKLILIDLKKSTNSLNNFLICLIDNI